MNTLFDIGPVLPEGFAYHPDFITAAEEEQLLKIIEEIPLTNMQFHQYEAKRKTAGFGQSWSFTERILQPGQPMPGSFDFLKEKIAIFFSIEKAALAQLLITEYPPGSVINWHRDAPPYEIIIGLSLLSSCTFKLRPYEKQKQNKYSTISLQVQPRSIYIMQGPSKSQWEHSTMPVKKKRYSITFRTLNNQL